MRRSALGRAVGEAHDWIGYWRVVKQEPLPKRNRDHPLRGIRKGYREAHVKVDWLVIYQIRGDELRLVRTGTHSDLFDE